MRRIKDGMMLLLSAFALFVMLPVAALIYWMVLLIDRAVAVAAPDLTHSRPARPFSPAR